MMNKFKIVCPKCGADPNINDENGLNYLAKTCSKCSANVFDFEIKPIPKGERGVDKND